MQAGDAPDQDLLPPSDDESDEYYVPFARIAYSDKSFDEMTAPERENQINSTQLNTTRFFYNSDA